MTNIPHESLRHEHPSDCHLQPLLVRGSLEHQGSRTNIPSECRRTRPFCAGRRTGPGDVRRRADRHNQPPAPPISHPHYRAARTDPRICVLTKVGAAVRRKSNQQSALWSTLSQRADRINGAEPLAKPGMRRKSQSCKRKRISFNGAFCPSSELYTAAYKSKRKNIKETYQKQRCNFPVQPAKMVFGSSTPGGRHADELSNSDQRSNPSKSTL